VDNKNLKITTNPPELNRTERINRSTGEIYPPTPDGIGVGFDHHHGKSAYFPTGANLVDSRLGSKLSRLVVDSNDFKRLLNGEVAATTTVGFLSDGLPALIGAKTSRVLLSSETISKQGRRHPEIKLADYRRLPDIIEKGLIIKDGTQTLVFIHIGNKVYRAAVKATKDGSELYLTSLFKSNQREINRMRKKGEVIREPL